MSLSRPIKYLVLSSLFLVTCASAGKFPRGCEVTGFAYNQNFLILSGISDQSYYLIQNKSNTKIELERHGSDEIFMSPPLQASINSMNWSAFATDVKDINFKCYQHVSENTAIVNCQDVLEICQYPRAKFALSNMGTYWITSNKSQNAIIQESIAKGIYLKW